METIDPDIKKFILDYCATLDFEESLVSMSLHCLDLDDLAITHIVGFLPLLSLAHAASVCKRFAPLARLIRVGYESRVANTKVIFEAQLTPGTMWSGHKVLRNTSDPPYSMKNKGIYTDDEGLVFLLDGEQMVYCAGLNPYILFGSERILDDKTTYVLRDKLYAVAQDSGTVELICNIRPRQNDGVVGGWNNTFVRNRTIWKVFGGVMFRLAANGRWTYYAEIPDEYHMNTNLGGVSMIGGRIFIMYMRKESDNQTRLLQFNVSYKRDDPNLFEPVRQLGEIPEIDMISADRGEWRGRVVFMPSPVNWYKGLYVMTPTKFGGDLVVIWSRYHFLPKMRRLCMDTAFNVDEIPDNSTCQIYDKDEFRVYIKHVGVWRLQERRD
jgi:hypothetical protein